MISIKKKLMLNLVSIVVLVVKKTFRHKSVCAVRLETWQLQSSVTARYPPTGSRVSLPVSTRVRGTHWKGVTTVVSS